MSIAVLSLTSSPMSAVRRQLLGQSQTPASPSQSSSSTSGSSGPTSSLLYLFTFLITIIVLGLVAGALLIRAYRVRRRFQLRVQEAIQAGRPLPEDAAYALGLIHRRDRLTKDKKHGPMPSMWDSEMIKSVDDYGLSTKNGAVWEDITPLCITREQSALDLLPPPPDNGEEFAYRPRRRPWYIRPFVAPDLPDLGAYYRANPGISHPAFATRPGITRTVTLTTVNEVVQPRWTIPDDGEEVVVGVLIAMPGEGQNELWDPEDPEEAEIPELALGVMECTVEYR